MKIPLGILVGFFTWLVGVEIFAEAWYRFREGDRLASTSWTIHWPQPSDKFRFEPIPEEARSILRYTHGESAIIEWPGDQKWQVFFFQWEPGEASAQLAVMHRPEICLPAAGFKFLSAASITEVEVGDLVFPFEGSMFEANGSAMHVFRCLWEDQPAAGLSQSRKFDLSIMGRLKGSYYGRRNLGQKLLQIGIVGAKNEEDARTQLRERLSQLVQIKGASLTIANRDAH